MADQGKKDDDKGTGQGTGADDQDTGTDTGDADDSDDDDDAANDWKPPTKADWDKVQESLRKARRDARAARKTGTGTGTGSNGDSGDTDKVDVTKAVADAVTTADGKWKPMVVRSAARAAFTEAGLVLPKGNAERAMKRVMRLLDIEDLDITDDGDVDGLTEQVEEIKSDYPDLFASNGTGTGGRARGGGRVDASDRGTGGGKAKSASELQAAALLGSSR
jgi:hypothetical protein